MKTCTFFGHRDCPHNIRPQLLKEIENLIINEDVSEFYVGCNGNFDFLTINCLKEMKQKYGHLNCMIVLDRLPTQKLEDLGLETILPEAIETTPPRFFTDRRNHWMLSKSEYVISYVHRFYGGAYKFYSLAKKKEKVVVNI